MKTTKRVLSLVLAISIMITGLVCSHVTASAQTTEKMNVTKMDGETLPIKEMKGLPEDIDDIDFFNNDDDDDPWSQSRLNRLVATGETESGRCFVAHSIDGVTFTTIYMDELSVFERFEKYGEYQTNWISLEEYGNGTFYFDVSVSISNPSTNYYDWADVYIKTDDFIKWKEISEIPTIMGDDTELDIPDESYLIGEYNGIYIANENNGDSIWDTELDCSYSWAYYTSTDGQNWVKREAPSINLPKLTATEETLVEWYGEIEITTAGVIFYVYSYQVTAGDGIFTTFDEYYITTDFTEYKKIDTSAVGKSKSYVDYENKTMLMDALSMEKTLYDGEPVFMKDSIKYSICEDVYDGETYWYDDEIIEYGDKEIYTLNKDTMSLELFNVVEEAASCWHHIFSKNHMWIFSQDLDENWYVNILEGKDNVKRYLWDGTESFNYVTRVSDDDTGSFIGEDGLARVKRSIGIKNDNTLYFTTDSFKTVFEYSLTHIAEEMYYVQFTHQGDVILKTYDEKKDCYKYYLFDASSVAELHGDDYNLGEETYNFENFGDSDSPYGHCFGMSMTSSAYYNNIINIENVGGNEKDDVYGLGFNSTVKEPICYYQNRQGYTVVKNSTVAGGKFYKDNVWDINSEWKDVVNYVKNHEYDDQGLISVCYYKNYGNNMISGHAVNFLYYKVVDGEERIYVYDNNFPDTETYFYKGADGKIYQAPYATFNGGIDAIQLVYIPEYFQFVGTYDFTRYVRADAGNIKIEGAIEYYEFANSENSVVLFEIPENKDTVTITPLKDNATFEYAGSEYSFGTVTETTTGTLNLMSSDDDDSTASFEIATTAFSIREPSRTTIRYKDGIILHLNGVIPEGARVEWAVENDNFDGGYTEDGTQCLLVSKKNGYTTVAAILYDANDNVIATDYIELRSKAGFFDKIGGFFRSLFGSTTIYEY